MLEIQLLHPNLIIRHQRRPPSLAIHVLSTFSRYDGLLGWYFVLIDHNNGMSHATTLRKQHFASFPVLPFGINTVTSRAHVFNGRGKTRRFHTTPK